MTAPALKPRPDASPEAFDEAPTPRLRPRSVRLAEAAAAEAPEAEASADASEVHRLRDRLEAAFAPAERSPAEALMMKLAIVAATGLFLRVALVHGGGLLTQLMR